MLDSPVYSAPKEFVVTEEIFAKSPLQHWEECAHDLDWFTPFENTLEWNRPYSSWFQEGTLNVSYNCLDRFINTPTAEKVAFYWESEQGESRSVTFAQMHSLVCRFANMLKNLDVEKGDRVAIYMPLVPEAIAAMHACNRIGAVHTVIFAGFSHDALRDRLEDAQAKVVLTADAFIRKGKRVPLKETVDKAVTSAVEHVVVLKRLEGKCSMQAGRDRWFHELMAVAHPDCSPEPMSSEDLLFILYTSGTTGKPKGIMHSTGGYLVGAHSSTRLVFDARSDDVFWCTADIGWITGHTYVAYGPMSLGMTQVIYEGAPSEPWKLIEKYHVTTFYTAPTAVRLYMKQGETALKECNLSSLRLLGSVGEPLNPEAWLWYYKHFGNSSCPIVDTWWQTETGSIMISTLPGYAPMKPGAVGRPLPGIMAAIRDGHLAITSPWPSMARGIYGNPDRFSKVYWSKWEDAYFPGDGASKDDDGDFWISGRVDDAMNVAGHLVGTMEVESALVAHASVAEAAVVSIPDSVKGESIVAFVVLREGELPCEVKNLQEEVAQRVGPFAKPQKVIFTKDVPKTRSGKIMRRLLRDLARNKESGDISTLENPALISDLKQRYEDD